MLSIILLFAYCWDLSPQLVHVCDTMYQHLLDKHDSHYLCTFGNLFIDFAIDTIVGQDAHSVLWAKYHGGRFDPYALCYSYVETK